MSVCLFVEGGGPSDGSICCRRGFRKLLERAGFQGRMPRIVASGSREESYSSFRTAATDPKVLPILLVDSESPVDQPVWQHLLTQDRWSRPENAADDQAQLMVVCMETWLLADPDALGRFFGNEFQKKRILPSSQLEMRDKFEVLESLRKATARCRTPYKKGTLSFQLLETLSPEKLVVLPHFKKLLRALENYIPRT